MESSPNVDFEHLFAPFPKSSSFLGSFGGKEAEYVAKEAEYVAMAVQ
jgi:hypothetical protein